VLAIFVGKQVGRPVGNFTFMTQEKTSSANGLSQMHTSANTNCVGIFLADVPPCRTSANQFASISQTIICTWVMKNLIKCALRSACSGKSHEKENLLCYTGSWVSAL
jgi:hypothetical protein